MLGYYEFHDDSKNSHKFWSIDDIGDGKCVISWGRIGTTGQKQTKDLGQGMKKVREKLSKGYRLVQAAAQQMVVERETTRRSNSNFVNALAKLGDE